MAVASGTAILISAAIGAATTAFSVHQQNMTSKRMSTIEGEQAQLQAMDNERKSNAEQVEAERAELQRQDDLQRIISAREAVFGSSGFSGSSGSFLNIQTRAMSQTARASRLDGINNRNRKIDYKLNSSQIRTQAQINRGARKLARRTRGIAAGGSILRDGLNAYGSGGFSKKPK